MLELCNLKKLNFHKNNTQTTYSFGGVYRQRKVAILAPGSEHYHYVRRAELQSGLKNYADHTADDLCQIMNTICSAIDSYYHAKRTHD